MRSKRLYRVSAGVFFTTAAMVAGLTAGSTAGSAHQSTAASATLASYPRAHGKIVVSRLSSAGKAWFLGPQRAADGGPTGPRAQLSLGSNVDANNPAGDAAPGQSETAVAANRARVLVAWNDATGLFVAPTTQRRASITGVAYSADGGRNFADLTGLPNNNPQQQWSGDPSVVAVGSNTFVVGSLYLPSIQASCATPTFFDVAVSVATVGTNGAVSFTEPIVAASGGNFCTILGQKPAPNLAFLDKDFLAYDPVSRTLAVSYTRLFFGFGNQSGTGQVEIKRAHLPADPRALATADFGGPVVVWPEEPTVDNEGAYVAVAPGGNTYVAWARNDFTNEFNGNPYVYIHAALVRPGATTPTVGGPASPRVITRGQVNSTPAGGVKPLSLTLIPGYNRGLGNDFPRLAVDQPAGRIVFVWNDASAHPLGDIWMRAVPLTLTVMGPITKVNDDNSYALHFLPAVSVRSNGAVVTSWYDRRRGGPNTTLTDYYGEVRANPSSNGRDFRITTGATDWNNTSSVIVPNFGDYTDSASTGTTTYFTWSDGRLGVSQPFVARR